MQPTLQLRSALPLKVGEEKLFLGLHQRRTCISLRTMLPDLREKGGGLRWAAESPCHKIGGSARLAGVGMLIALLSALGCCSQAPGRAAKLQELYAPGLISPCNALALAIRFTFISLRVVIVPG